VIWRATRSKRPLRTGSDLRCPRHADRHAAAASSDPPGMVVPPSHFPQLPTTGASTCSVV
jgi:hypothetical protein